MTEIKTCHRGHEMTNEITRNRMRNASKSKTFQKGEDAIPEILDFVVNAIESEHYQPEGTQYSGDGLTPHDPQDLLKFKYIITVRKFFL